VGAVAVLLLSLPRFVLIEELSLLALPLFMFDTSSVVLRCMRGVNLSAADAIGRTHMSTGPVADPELVTVFDTNDEPAAMVVHALLTSAGIESLMATLQAPQDVLPGVGGIVVRVKAAQAEEARRVIDEYRNTPAPEEDDVDEDSGLAPEV